MFIMFQLIQADLTDFIQVYICYFAIVHPFLRENEIHVADNYLNLPLNVWFD